MKASKTARLGMLLGTAMILSYIDSLIPLFPEIPGVKAGLANVAVVYALCRYGAKEASLVQALRILLMSLLFGNAASLIYSFSGAAVSMAAMCLLKKTERFSVPAVSAAGGVFHNMGQLLAVVLLMKVPGIAYYVPLLIVFGLLSGIAVGFISDILQKRVHNG